MCLFAGSKSFSHSFAAIAKFHPTLKSLSESEESQICILRSMFDLWSSHHQGGASHLYEVLQMLAPVQMFGLKTSKPFALDRCS